MILLSYFMAIVIGIAIAALVIAVQTRREMAELRRLIAGAAAGEAPAPEVPRTSRPQPDIPIYRAPAEPVRSDPAPPPPASSAPIFPPADDAAHALPPFPPSSRTPATRVDWENLVGIRLFSWIAGIALVLSAVFLFKYSVEHGWLRPAVRAALGLGTGAGLLILCEMRIARAYRFTANAMDGAGIAILYATLFSLYARWQLWSATAAFGGMLLVTAIAVFLSTRRDSIFIALLGLIGGFATPALLSSGENRPIALFSYLLLLNGGISWIAWKKRWPMLTALSVTLTVLYQWVWVERFLTSAQLPLAAGIFLVFALVGASSFWPEAEGDERDRTFRRVASAGAVLPLLFAFFTAIVPEYGSQYHVLFGFLLLVATGLAAVAFWRGPLWLHTLSGGATLVTFFIWIIVSYTPEAWPGILGWLGAFVALYLAADTRLRTGAVLTAPVLFFVFFALAIREPARYGILAGALFALLTVVLAYSFRSSRPALGATAIVLSVISLMPLSKMPAPLLIVCYAILFTLLLGIARFADRPLLPLVAVPLYAAALVAAIDRAAGERVVLASILCLLFFAHAFVARRTNSSLQIAYISLVLANVIFFIAAYAARSSLPYEAVFGVIPLVQAAFFGLLLHREARSPGDEMPRPSRSSDIALLAGAALGFFTTAIAVQLEKEWITIAFALEAAALAWLFTRIPHRGLIVWSGGLAAVVFARLVLNPAVLEYHEKAAVPVLNWYLYAYLTSASAMFAIVFFMRVASPPLARLAAVTGTLELFVLLNIQIADYYSAGRTLTFNFVSSSLAQDLTYTIGWALFAMAMLVAGLILQARSVRIAALGLLLVTILKCFLHDLARLGGLYRVGSLFGLAVALVVVGLLLQKFVMLKRPIEHPAGS
jgi:hypothetical protein